LQRKRKIEDFQSLAKKRKEKKRKEKKRKEKRK